MAALPLITRTAAFGVPFFLLLIAYPLCQTIVISFFRISTLAQTGPYVGLGNDTALLQSEEFWNACANTLVWTVGCQVLQLGLGGGFALTLNGKLFWRPVARSLVLFPIC
jgi:ABC-type sugar transport system permease subunit